MTEAQILTWIEEWCNLYPEHIKWNDEKIKSDPKQCIKKMAKLFKTNPHYTKDLVFAATKKYLNLQETKNWEYTKRSTYFISKTGELSLLEKYCEEILKDSLPNKNVTVNNFYNDFI